MRAARVDKKSNILQLIPWLRQGNRYIKKPKGGKSTLNGWRFPGPLVLDCVPELITAEVYIQPCFSAVLLCKLRVFCGWKQSSPVGRPIFIIIFFSLHKSLMLTMFISAALLSTQQQFRKRLLSLSVAVLSCFLSNLAQLCEHADNRHILLSEMPFSFSGSRRQYHVYDKEMHLCKEAYVHIYSVNVA